MTIVKHELRQGKTTLLIWTAAIAFLLMICIFIFPEIQGDMDTMGALFGSMGSFTAAFGMDRLNFGTLIGFYAVECGNILGLGGAFFASLTGVSILSKEEKDRTAEFLLTHPVSRVRVVTEKLAALLIQITAMDLMILALSLVSMRLIGESIPWKEVMLMHGAYFLLQLELAGVCFGIPAPRQRRHRDRAGGSDVLSESDRQYDGSCEIFEVHHPIWILRRRGSHSERKAGYRIYRSWDAVCLHRYCGCILAVHPKRHSLKDFSA